MNKHYPFLFAFTFLLFLGLGSMQAMAAGTVDYPGKIEHRDRVITGVVTDIDEKGTFISVRLDSGGTKTYYLHNETEVFKGTTLMDLSVLYEGDRVKLIFSEYDTPYISSIEVNTQGIKIERLYKGSIYRIDPIRNKLTIKNEQVFQDWRWQPDKPFKNTSYSYSTKIPIYIGNQPVKKDRLRFYANHDVYFVTVSQFGQEVIQKMVIKQKYERTFYEPMRLVDYVSKRIRLNDSGLMRYHSGTILIRNGRLVDADSLAAPGSAFVVTDGEQTSQYANVIHITNDGFQSPNLANHSLYFGQISKVNGYQLSLRGAKLLTPNNYWKDAGNPTFSFSDDTTAVEDFHPSTLDVISKDELTIHIGEYGYFYVANNTIIGIHTVKWNSSPAPMISVGRIDSIQVNSNLHFINVRNVSQWYRGAWVTAGYIQHMNIEQATIIRDGKVISAEDLKPGDRLYLVHESSVKGRILLVN
ncbi:hypothetical protein [Pseudobacillus wudalianchiensis]|uniref:Uncharacterized protein n=1 Tax=Pseudobacillus wudalianchiensis TaxID=1743143 RepID=A0A1B9AYJ1_9BACI|nr:hypothetical protein [Bacillus wudalianchiensis]OCA88894.1 hypothetical protein A8F95_05550 [Bacillus wudalianchiensis]